MDQPVPGEPPAEAEALPFLEESGSSGEQEQPFSLPEADQATSLDRAIRELEMSDPRFTQALPFALPAASAASIHEPVPERLPDAIRYWISHYGRNPVEAARAIRELTARAPDVVAETLLALYDGDGWGEATPFLAGLLGRSPAAIEKICDTDVPLARSIELARTLAQHEPRFDAQFAKSLLIDDQLSEQTLERGLAVLEKFSTGGRLIPILIQFLRNPDARIRSMAALLLGRIRPTRSLMYRLMRDEDARVRANFVEGLWNSSTDHVVLFLQALQDTSQRVVGNALVGLQRAGEASAVIAQVARLTRHPDAPSRATAAWVMGQTGEQRYLPVLRHMVNDSNPGVRRNALRALIRIKKANPAITGA